MEFLENLDAESLKFYLLNFLSDNASNPNITIDLAGELEKYIKESISRFTEDNQI